MIGLATFCNRLRAVFVEAKSLSRENVGEVGPDGVEIDIFACRLFVHADIGRLDEQDRIVLVERVALAPADFAHHAAAGRGDEMLHLHGLQHGDLLSGLDQRALGDIDRHDRAEQRRGNRDCALGPRMRRRLSRWRVVGRRLEIIAMAVLRACGDQLAKMSLDEARVDAIGEKIRMRQQRLQKGNVRVDADDAELAERADALGDGGAIVGRRRMHDQLGDQRVEGRARAIPRIAECIDAHAGPRGNVEGGDLATARQRLAGGIHRLEIHARLDRIAARRARLGKADVGEALACGYADLRLHEIDAEHFLRHRMFDLQARIGLDEGEIGLVRCFARVDQEFERAEIVVVRRSRERHRRVRDLFTQARRERRGWCDFDQLLVAALDRAFALAEMREAAMTVAENLDFDVPCALDQALRIERPIAEGALRLRRAAREGFRDLVCLSHGAHAAPAAARNRLQHDRRIDDGEESARLVGVAHDGALNDRRIDAERQFACLQLVAEQV